MTTYKAIQHQEVGAGGAASITFSDIPQTYTDLVVVASLRDTGDVGTAFAYMQFNNTTTGYTSRLLRGSGSSTSSTSNSDGTSLRGRISPNDATANTFGSTTWTIPNYTSSNYKSVSIDSVQEENNTESWQTITAGLWSNTAAITSLKIFAGNSNLAQYSSATLFGVTRAALPTPTDVYSDSLLEEVVLTSSAASVTFSGLAAYAALGYTNLQIRAVAKTDRAATNDNVILRFNSDSGSNYSCHYLRGSSGSVTSGALTTETKIVARAIGGNTGNFGAVVIDILDPFETTKYTTTRQLGGYATDIVELGSGNWRNTAAVTSIILDQDVGSNFLTGSRFSLYGSK